MKLPGFREDGSQWAKVELLNVERIKVKKRVIIHIGPHKTGTTSVQKFLLGNKDSLFQEGFLFLHDEDTHEAAILLAKEKFEDAERKLEEISETIKNSTCNTIILSQEDFCGDIPGRSKRREVYSKLTKNLRIIMRALRPHDVRFIFFERNEEDWLKSCYHQSLRYRTDFHDFRDFHARFSTNFSWAQKLEKPRSVFGERLVVEDYYKDVGDGISKILKLAGASNIHLPTPPQRVNSAPSIEASQLLERVNKLSSFKATAWFSKKLILANWKPRPSYETSSPPAAKSNELAAVAFPALSMRSASRFAPQDVIDLLPAQDIDLSQYLFDILPTEVELPSESRVNMADQSRILDYHLRGKSRLAKINALAISYLRRDTQHTQKASVIFHRIWREHGIQLVNELSTRWLISTLQTFLDHGLNEAQRQIGASGYFYANMIKIYEGERAIEGAEQNATYSEASPQTPNEFRGLDRYSVGGTDLLLNTNALLLDLARSDDVAGLVMMEFLLRVKSSGNVFTRMDKTRKEKDISVNGFEDTWSFFE